MNDDPRYAAINDGRSYPPLSRAEAGGYARMLLKRFGSPADAAMRGDGQGGGVPATRKELERIYQRYIDHHRQGWGRRCWASSAPTVGNDTGWGRLIHDVSHILQEYRHPGLRPHDPGHEAIELAVLKHLESNLFLQPKPRPAKPNIEQRRSSKLAAIAERIQRWESKLKRAQTALRKLNRQRKCVERARQKTIMQNA